MTGGNRLAILMVGLLVSSLLPGCKPDRQQTSAPPVRVAAAADLALAFGELGRDFEQQTGHRVTFSFGSTGLLARQLREGAPFDLFAAANESFVEEVVAAGACDGATKAPYARGRIAVWTRRGSGAAPAAFEELANPRFSRIAIAHPEHAPYGQAARQAFQHAGIWSAVAPKLVFGENVRQALQFARTGNADAAVVALALVIQDRDNPWLLVDEAMHRPIHQALVVCHRGGNFEGGKSFARFVNAEPGRALMRRHGFLLPGEGPPHTP
jgi:molybdate transport system substrate-binding protein